MLILIGQGLSSELDLSLRSIEILKSSENVFIESYTSISKINLDILEGMINKKIEKADREFTESNNKIIELSKTKKVSLIVIGTPMFATTHTDIILRAKESGIQTQIVHNQSIMNVMGCYGLYSYSFGRTISIPFYEDNWKPKSFYDYFIINYKNNLHTLCLLDIKVKEIKKETLFKEIKEYNEPRFMTPNQALEQLLFCDNESDMKIFTAKYKFFVVSRFGTEEEMVYYDTINNLLKLNFGEPLHSLILPSKLDMVESENVESYFKYK